MKKITVSIVIIIAIIIGVIGNLLIDKKNINNSESDKLSKIYSLIIESNNNLNEVSEAYLKVWYIAGNHKEIDKKKISEIINVDYEKILKNTSRIEKTSFNETNEVLECLKEYYENSGVYDNIQNKLKNIKTYLNDINLKNGKEEKVYSDLKLIYGQLNEYEYTIFNIDHNYKEYREKIEKIREEIKVNIETIAKYDFIRL